MAIRLSPSDPAIGLFSMHYSLAHLYLKQHEKAVECGQKALQKRAPWPANACMTAALEHSGQTDEAQHACKELMDIISHMHFLFMILNRLQEECINHLLYIKLLKQVDL